MPTSTLQLTERVTRVDTHTIVEQRDDETVITRVTVTTVHEKGIEIDAQVRTERSAIRDSLFTAGCSPTVSARFVLLTCLAQQSPKHLAEASTLYPNLLPPSPTSALSAPTHRRRPSRLPVSRYRVVDTCHTSECSEVLRLRR